MTVIYKGNVYIKAVDGIGGEQKNILSENLVVRKPLEKPWNEEATLKALFFSLIPCLLLYSVLKAGILL